MQLKLTHNKRPFQEVTTTWDKFADRYLRGRDVAEICMIHDELHAHNKTELTDEDGTLYIEVIK